MIPIPSLKWDCDMWRVIDGLVADLDLSRKSILMTNSI